MDIQNILETFGFYGEIFSPRPKESFTFPFYSYQLLCRPVWARQASTYNVSIVLLIEILKEMSREGDLLNNYLSVHEDLFFNAKVSDSKVNEVRDHLLSKHALLEVGLLIVLIIRTLLS